MSFPLSHICIRVWDKSKVKIDPFTPPQWGGENMARPSRLSVAKKDILTRFSEASQKVYSETEIARVLLANRHTWKLAESTRASDFISFLERHGDLKKYQFRSEYYDRKITRYSWGKASLYELALSIKQRAYLCHATAVTLHGLARLRRGCSYDLVRGSWADKLNFNWPTGPHPERFTI
jgi:hypothetical protein